MLIKNHAILHNVCLHIRYSRASLLPKQDFYSIKLNGMQVQELAHLIVPYNLQVDRGKDVLSTQLVVLSNSVVRTLITIAVKAYWSINGENSDDSLGCRKRSFIVNHPHASLALVIDYANLLISHSMVRKD